MSAWQSLSYRIVNELGINEVDDKIADMSSKSHVTTSDVLNLGSKTFDAAINIATVVDGVNGGGQEMPINKHGYGTTDDPVRIQGPWTKRDLERASNGQGPLDFIPKTNKLCVEMPLEFTASGDNKKDGPYKTGYEIKTDEKTDKKKKEAASFSKKRLQSLI